MEFGNKISEYTSKGKPKNDHILEDCLTLGTQTWPVQQGIKRDFNNVRPLQSGLTSVIVPCQRHKLLYNDLDIGYL